MIRFLLAVCTTCVVLSQMNLAVAQMGRRYFQESDYGRLGLEQVWTSQVQFDSARAQVSCLVLHVVGMDSYEKLQEVVYRVYDVSYDGRSVRFSENDTDASGQRIGPDEAKRLAEKEVILLEARGLKPELTIREVPPTTLYVQSNSGTLHAVDAENGKTLWAVTIGHPRWPMVAPAANDRYVAAVNGSSLYLLDRVTGEPIWDRPLGMNPAMAITMSEQYVFVPGLSGQIEGYRLPTDEDDHRASQPWVYHSGGQITAAPLCSSSTVSWATDRGQMFVASIEGPQMLYRRQTGGPIYGRATFLPPDRLVIASTDGYVSAIEQESGSLQWNFSTGFDVYQTPISQNDYTYAVTNRDDLFCISSTDGTEQWVSPGIERLLACGKDRLYAQGKQGKLVALDKKTGRRLATLTAPAYRLAYVNSLTDRIYLLTNDGTLLCLREADAYYPTIYQPLPQPPEEAETSAGQRPPSATAPASPPPTAPAEDGGLFGEDIFGAEPGMDEEPDAGLDAEPPADEGTDEPQESEGFDDPFDFG